MSDLGQGDGQPCPLCGVRALRPFHRDPKRRYLRCETCLLTFVPEADQLDREAERDRYLLHENSADDAGYRAFLQPVVDGLLGVLAQGSMGLDFGCGPGPAVPAMMAEHGFEMVLYDPFFASDEAVLAQRYDFVTCTEAIEHFRTPALVLDTLDGLLKPGATLAVLTGILTEDADFPAWHYIRDMTHVCFFRPETLAWIGRHWGWSLDLSLPRLALFTKAGEEGEIPRQR